MNEWISVRERLPEIGQCVLLSLRSLDIEVGFRSETEPYFYCNNADGYYIEPQDILAWQPLPQPYKGESVVDMLEEAPNDVVNHPSHYETGKFECIEVMEEALGRDVVIDFCLANAFKYLYRSKRKNGLEDIKKAQWYINRYIMLSEKEEEDD